MNRFAKDFLHILWTDKDLLHFIQHHFPEYLGYYNALSLNIQRSDFARYLLLIQFGGVYLDLDIELRRPLTEVKLTQNTILNITTVDTAAAGTKYKSRKPVRLPLLQVPGVRSKSEAVCWECIHGCCAELDSAASDDPPHSHA